MKSLAFTALVALMVVLVSAAPVAANPSEMSFEIEPGSFHITPSTLQAGAHADLITTFNFAHEPNGEENTYNDVRTTVVNLPAGFIGNNTAIPTCNNAELAGEGLRSECPADTQVGEISLDLTLFQHTPELLTVPVFNMEANTGAVATLGFHAAAVTQILPVSVRPGDPGLTATSPSIYSGGEIKNIPFTVWGVPASPIHNP